MIISRTPLRITLGGGGTDDPGYVAKHGGFAITAAINSHVYVGLNDSTFVDGYLLKYSETEHVKTIDEIKHPIFREALRLYNVPSGVEIISFADIPGRTGLGSSGAFSVGLCRLLSTYMGHKVHQEEAAEEAARVELDILGRPGGKQDHYATALGGLRALTFQSNGIVYDTIPEISARTLHRLEDSLCMFYTGQSRDADAILSTQTTVGLDEIKAHGYLAQDALIDGDIIGLGELMDEHWILKQRRSREMSSSYIDYLYDIALRNGAVGGKLVGAGGGGFLLFIAHDHEQLTQAMTTAGAPETPVLFDHDGCSIIANTK